MSQHLSIQHCHHIYLTYFDFYMNKKKNKNILGTSVVLRLCLNNINFKRCQVNLLFFI